MSVVYLQERIKKLEEQVQELEAELYREVAAKDMPKLRERPGGTGHTGVLGVLFQFVNCGIKKYKLITPKELKNSLRP